MIAVSKDLEWNKFVHIVHVDDWVLKIKANYSVALHEASTNNHIQVIESHVPSESVDGVDEHHLWVKGFVISGQLEVLQNQSWSEDHENTLKVWQ